MPKAPAPPLYNVTKMYRPGGGVGAEFVSIFYPAEGSGPGGIILTEGVELDKIDCGGTIADQRHIHYIRVQRMNLTPNIVTKVSTYFLDNFRDVRPLKALVFLIDALLRDGGHVVLMDKHPKLQIRVNVDPGNQVEGQPGLLTSPHRPYTT